MAAGCRQPATCSGTHPWQEASHFVQQVSRLELAALLRLEVDQRHGRLPELGLDVGAVGVGAGGAQAGDQVGIKRVHQGGLLPAQGCCAAAQVDGRQRHPAVGGGSWDLGGPRLGLDTWRRVGAGVDDQLPAAGQLGGGGRVGGRALEADHRGRLGGRGHGRGRGTGDRHWRRRGGRQGRDDGLDELLGRARAQAQHPAVEGDGAAASRKRSSERMYWPRI